ncbi:MAG: hypothetical protein HYZ58_19810 [Acidobacteria bacterium]|nr:hypothetical protein [Acidobacteriota bacterium]
MIRRQIGRVLGVAAAVLVALPASAQQRPLVTEDPEPVGAGRVLVEMGIDYLRDLEYPVSGLRGNLISGPNIGVSIGLSSIAELQIDGGLRNRLGITSRFSAPLSNMLTVVGNSTNSVEDFVVATKVRIAAETASRPSFGVRFATRLPNADNESGLGLDTTDFFTSMLTAKTAQSIRIVGNIGFGILGDPTRGDRQNDVLTYGISGARAVTDEIEVVGELNGRADMREGDPPPGTESRAGLRGGVRYTKGAMRLDTAVIFGMTVRDPSIGFTFGFTYVLNTFRIP